MSLVIDLQVTKSNYHLEQIHNIVITNVSLVKEMKGNQTPYTAALDGVMLPEILYHNRDDGALVLLRLVLEKFEAVAWHNRQAD